MIPKAKTLEALNQALLLAKEDAIDYFTKEAERIEYRALVLAGMGMVTIPPVIFNGDPAEYVKVEKVGKTAGDAIIIADTITARKSGSGIYEVTAKVTGPDESRQEGKYVTVRWNSNSGIDFCKALLIAAFEDKTTPPEQPVIDQLRVGIGTYIPE